MTRDDKFKIVEALKEKFKSSDYFYFTDASGMSVAQIDKFRSHCFKMGIEYKVVKNALIKKALEVKDTDYSSFDKTVFKGFSGIMFAGETGNGPAKALKEFRKKNKLQKPILKGASIDGALFIGNDMLDTLASLKSKNELIGEVIGLLQSPEKNVMGALRSGGEKLAAMVLERAGQE